MQLQKTFKFKDRGSNCSDDLLAFEVLVRFLVKHIAFIIFKLLIILQMD